MEKKYSLIPTENSSLFQIIAEKDFSDVKKGDKGGFVEGERNLSQNGNCWIYDESQVIGFASIADNVIVRDVSTVGNNAEIRGDAFISSSFIRDHVYIKDSVSIYNSTLRDETVVLGSAVIKDSTLIGDILVQDNAQIQGVKLSFMGGNIRGEGYISPTHPCYLFGINDDDNTVTAYMTKAGRLRISTMTSNYFSLKQYRNSGISQSTIFSDCIDSLFPDRVEDEEEPHGYYSIMYDEMKLYKGKEVYRVKSNEDFRVGRSYTLVHKGELGGYIQNEKNLQEYSWIFDESTICGESIVINGSSISQRTFVEGNSVIDCTDLIYSQIKDCLLSSVIAYDCSMSDFTADYISLFDQNIKGKDMTNEHPDDIVDVRIGREHVYAYRNDTGKIIMKSFSNDPKEEKHIELMDCGKKIVELINAKLGEEE